MDELQSLQTQRNLQLQIEADKLANEETQPWAPFCQRGLKKLQSTSIQ